MKNIWKNKTIVIGIHESIPSSPAHELRDFLLTYKPRYLGFIAHPLLYFSEGYARSSYKKIYTRGKLYEQHSARIFRLPEVLLYVKDLCYSFMWIYQAPMQVDLYFGVNPLNALVGILLRKAGKVKCVVYYNIDYTPKRFSNRFLNRIFHVIERYCCYASDINWVGTKRTVSARKSHGVQIHKCAYTIVVPDGNHSRRIKQPSFLRIDRYRLVYLGHLDRKQGLDLVLDSWKRLHGWNKRLSLMIIGKGDYQLHILKKIKKYALQNISIRGFIEDDREVESLLVRSGVGLAPYREDKDSFTYFSEAGKPKFYLGCGLPVIVTHVPEIARSISSENAGIEIKYNTDQFTKAVKKVVNNEKSYKQFRRNAINLGKKYDWNDLFSQALQETLQIHE